MIIALLGSVARFEDVVGDFRSLDKLIICCYSRPHYTHLAYLKIMPRD